MWFWDWVRLLPDLQVQVLLAGGLAVLACLAPLFGRHVLRLRAETSRDAFAFDAFKSVMGITAIVLAFSLVQAIANLRVVEAMVAKEASSISALDRMLTRFSAESQTLRPALATFAQGQIDTEWPLLAKGQRSYDVDQLLNAVSQGVRNLMPSDRNQTAQLNDMLRTADDLSETRELIISAELNALPPIFYITSSGLTLIALMLAVGTVASRNRLVGLAAISGAIGLIFAFLVIIDHPLSGGAVVSPEPIAKVLVANGRRAA